MYGLAQLYQSQKRWQDADTIMRQSLKINQAGLPKDHPYIFDDLTNLINTQLNIINLQAAEDFLNQIQKMQKLNEDQKQELSILLEKFNAISNQ